ncbi:MAG: ABC transporter substrate-binding protein [Deltaproteobacteria bacterium]|nr:ABC transporter substrate-binding protein [Deltaproteobacteria bacterium]
MRRITALLGIVAGLALGTAAFAADEIVIGHLADITGGTGDVGKPYAEGVKAYTDYINAHGGINGKKIKLLSMDYAYKIPEALNLYKKFKDQDKVVAIQGWGSGDTEALKEQVAKDEIPYFSASYSAHLTDPKKSPYNFFCAPDYSTAARAGLKYLKDSWKEKRKPKVAFIYPDNGYGKAPIPGAKKYAEELGFEIVPDENVALNAIEATTQLLNLKKSEPDFAWIGGTKVSTSVILKDAKKLGLKTKFFGNIWSGDEDMPKLTAGAEEGYLVMLGSDLYGEPGPGMKIIQEVTKGQPVPQHWIRGWISMMTMCEALKIADKNKALNGPGIKKAAETLTNFNPMDLAPAITYTATDHRPSMTVVVAEFQGGKLLKRKATELPRKPEWLGL